MKKVLLVLALILLPYLSLYPQSKQWRFYVNGNDITSVCPISGDSLYFFGSREAGIGIFNLNSMQYVGGINKLSSTIPTHNIRQIRKRSSYNDTFWICTDEGLIRLTDSNLVVYNTQNSGLPTNFINDITIDAIGYRWIATDQGLVLNYDTNWIVYNTQNSGIPSDRINFVNVDAMGNVWIATDMGIGMFDRNNWYVWNTGNSGLPDNYITFIVFDRMNGSKWIGTFNGGLVNWLGNNFFVYDTSNSVIPSNTVTSFAYDTSYNKWVGTSNGILLISTGEWQVLNTQNSRLSNNYVNNIFINSNTDVKFIATKDSLTIIRDSSFYVVEMANSKLPNNQIKKVVEGQDLVKWIATERELVSFDGDNWGVLSQNNLPFGGKSINDLAVDSQNRLWVATDSGLYCRSGNSWTSFVYDSIGLPSNIVLKILPEGSNLWVGTDSGLAKLSSNNQWTRLDTIYNGLFRNEISALALDNEGKLYVGLGFNGAAIYSPDTLIVYNDTTSPLVRTYVTFIFPDGQTNLWIGTTSYGLLLRDTTWTFFNPLNSPMTDYFVREFDKDLGNWYWTATGGQGLVSFQDTNWLTYPKNNSPLASNVIYDILVDRSNNKWLATSMGLYVFNVDSIRPELKTRGVSTSICQGTTILINYYSFGLYEPDNQFLVLLSDSAGRFDNPTIIGRYIGRKGQPILCFIPKGLPESDFYRIKVVSTNPAIDGGDNGENISIRTIPKPKIYGDNISCSNATQLFWREINPSLVYRWEVIGGTIIGNAYSDTIRVQWNTRDSGFVKLVEYNQFGCSDSSIMTVRISSLPGKILYGSRQSCVGDTYIYSTSDSTNIQNYWTVVNGTLVKKYSPSVVVIQWDRIGQGYVKLRRVNQAGCVDSVSLSVDVDSTPVANIIGKNEVMTETISIYKTTKLLQSFNVKWKVTNGQIIGPDNLDSVVVGWPMAGYGKVKVLQTSLQGCSDSSEKIVRIFEYAAVSGDTLVCENNETYFEAISNLGASNLWSVIGGSFISDNTNRRVWIKWGNSGTGRIKLVQYVTGTIYKDSVEVIVHIAAKPTKPTITDSAGILVSSATYGNQWYYNGVIILGDTNRTIVPLRTGYYTVQVTTAPGCVSEMSEPYYTISGVEEEQKLAKIFPNPTIGNLVIVPNNGQIINRIIIRDQIGNELYKQIVLNSTESLQLDMTQFVSGIYIVELGTNRGIEHHSIVVVK